VVSYKNGPCNISDLFGPGPVIINITEPIAKVPVSVIDNVDTSVLSASTTPVTICPDPDI